MLKKNNYLKVTLLSFGCISIMASCNSIRPKKVYGVWNLISMEVGGQTVTGKSMGNPSYEFTSEGQRIHKLLFKKDTVPYVLKGKEISYPNTKLPAINIISLKKGKMELKNEKTHWILEKQVIKSQ